VSQLGDILKSPNAVETLAVFRTRTFRYEDLFELFEDLKGLFVLGYTALWSDRPPDYGIIAYKGEGDEESSVDLRISLKQARVTLFDHTPEAGVLATAFQTSEGKRLLLEALREKALSTPKKDPVPSPTCWERLLAQDTPS